MQQREFGHTGLHVSPITLGSWPMSGDRYGRIDDSEAVSTIRRALEQGITSFDTAPAYGAGHAEETLGAALDGRRDEAVITTKCGIVPSASGPPGRNASRASILREIDDSLRRLRTDHVDVYLVHWPDPKTPLEETLGAMDEVQRAGKTRLTCSRSATTCSTAAWSGRCSRTAASMALASWPTARWRTGC